MSSDRGLYERIMAGDRLGCCEGWLKPCSYHEGWQDALDSPVLRRAVAITQAVDGLRFTADGAVMYEYTAPNGDYHRGVVKTIGSLLDIIELAGAAATTGQEEP